MALDKFGPNAFATGSVTSDALATGTIATEDIADDAITYAKWGGTNLGRRNLVINGAMNVAQRGTSAITSGTAYPVDRFFLTNGTAGTFSIQYSTTSPSNFGQSIALTITGTDASPDPTDFSSIRYKVEHNDMRHLYWGYSTASTVTLSFYVRSSVTGTHGGAIRNDSVNKAYPFSYTIDTADTWERKTITIAGETAGSWGSGANTGLEINWCIGAGSSRLGTAGAWNSNNNVGATGQVNLYATNGSTFYLTGVQLEVGESATPFEHRSYGEELALCQRYFYRTAPAQNYGYYADAAAESTTAASAFFQYPVQMRASPTGSSSGAFQMTSNTSRTVTAINFAAASQSGCRLDIRVATGYTAGYAYSMRNLGDPNAYLQFDAEL
jgi:hypothetical protein